MIYVHKESRGAFTASAPTQRAPLSLFLNNILSKALPCGLLHSPFFKPTAHIET